MRETCSKSWHDILAHVFGWRVGTKVKRTFSLGVQLLDLGRGSEKGRTARDEIVVFDDGVKKVVTMISPDRIDAEVLKRGDDDG